MTETTGRCQSVSECACVCACACVRISCVSHANLVNGSWGLKGFCFALLWCGFTGLGQMPKQLSQAFFVRFVLLFWFHPMSYGDFFHFHFNFCSALGQPAARVRNFDFNTKLFTILKWQLKRIARIIYSVISWVQDIFWQRNTIPRGGVAVRARAYNDLAAEMWPTKLSFAALKAN